MKRIYMAIISILCSIGIAIAISHAWFVNGYDVDPLATGSSAEAYYHSGTGTKDDPFIITTPRHLYNFAWLQYLGTYNKTIEDGNYKNYYFQLGVKGTTNQTLNMDGWYLPPIGTTVNPFIGNFNGQGWKITNLHTTNNFGDFGNKHPSTIVAPNETAAIGQENFANCDVIGFFGSVGKFNQTRINPNVNSGTVASNNSVSNFYLVDCYVNTATSATILGSVAGYVNTTVSDVGLVSSHLNIESSNPSATSLTSKTSTNISEFAVVGYAEEAYTTQKTKNSTIIYNPTYDYSHFNFKGMGAVSDWGGSMNMSDLYSRIVDKIPYTDQNVNYIDQELRYTFSDTIVQTTNSTVNMSISLSNDENGNYVKYLQTNGRYNYLNSVYRSIVLVDTNGTENGFKISNGTHYLNITSTTPQDNTLNFVVSVSSDTSSSDATVWNQETNSPGINIYTYNPDDGHKYYLVANPDLSLSVSHIEPTIWNWDSSNNTYYTTINSTVYYLKFFNGSWTLKPTYVISDGSGNYLSYNNGLTNATEENASMWAFTNDGENPKGKIYTDNNIYLRYNNGLTTSNANNGTTWLNDGYGIYYNGYYIQYNNTNWVAERPLTFYISYNNGTTDNYLSFDYNNGNPRFINTTTPTTVWTFSANNGNPSGTISYYSQENGTTYYLRNNNGTLQVSTTSTNWTNNGAGLNNNNYYLQFNTNATNKWELSTNRSFYITALVGSTVHYLTLSGTTITDTTTEADATLWKAATWSNAGLPSGVISTYSGTNYYLRFNNDELTAGTNNSNNSWTNTNGKLSRNNSYIQFFNGKWVCGRTYYISDGTHYLTTTNNTSFSSTLAPQTLWVFSNNSTVASPQGRIYSVINGSLRYLYYDNTLTLNANSYTTWVNDGNNGLYYDTYYIHLDDWNPYGFKISYNDTYLNRNGTTSVTGGTSYATATIWHVNASNHIYTVYNNTNYYLYCDGGYLNRVYLETTETGYINVKSGNYIYLGRNYSNYRLGYNNNRWQYINANSGYSLTWTGLYENLGQYESINENIAQKSSFSKFEPSNKTVVQSKKVVSTKTNTTLNVYSRNEGTFDQSLFNYIPLNVSKNQNNYVVDTSNTGYIMSGAYSGANNSGLDIRVSEYYINNINRNDTNINYTNSNTQVSDGAGTVYGQNFVSFKSNVIKTVNSSGIVNINDSSNTYQKYASSKRNLEDVLSNSGANNNFYLYGLHFMSASININHLITAPKVLINGVYYTNYQMPEDCIDFTVAKNGYINFFAGTYYPQNDAFFSLHQIFRDETDANKDGKPDNPIITDIKHIYSIYKANSSYGDDYKTADVVYKYSDGTYSVNGFNPNSGTYDLVFNYTWIESPGTYQNLGNQNDYKGDVFYFEIPVNKGEFALGSVANKTGAYLFYLDIGANAAPVDRTIITQQTTSTQESLVYVNGIQILATGQTFTSDANSCVAVIKTTNSGAVNISRTGNTVTFTASSTLDSTYKDDGITLSGATWAPTATATSTSKVLRYVDYNRATEKLYYTTIYNNGSSNTSFDCYRIDNISTGAKTQLTYTGTDADEWGILVITDGTGISTSLSDFANIKNMTYGNTTIIDYYSFINTANLATYTQTIDMTVAEDATVQAPADGDYVYEHSYHLSGNAITMAPNGLIVNIGPTLKNSATISGPTNNVVTVTIGNYVFTYNANAMNNTNKTVTIYVASS